MSIIGIRIKGRVLRLHKAVVSPLFRSRSVLTKEPWAFVSLSLKRDKKDEARFYWEQGRAFYRAAQGLPLESAPLLLYYSFLNAVKALLSAKGIPFDPYHGVKEWKPAVGVRESLTAVGVEIKPNGILPSLSSYYKEQESRRKHSLQELFFNIPFVHRSYCLTYESQTEMFVPLTDCVYAWDRATGRAYFSASLSRDVSPGRTLKRLPPSLAPDIAIGGGAIRSQASVPFEKPNRPSAADIERLLGLHRGLREDVYYINGAETLWYLKAVTSGPQRLSRQCPTLVLAAMHRLSELCRYRPMSLASYLDGQKNWLLSEFIEMSGVQFVDEIAAELTGQQFLVPNIRTAS